MNIDKKLIDIDKNEVLRYLGYKGQEIDDKLNMLIDSCILEVKTIINPKAVYDYKGIKQIEEGIAVLNTNLILYGKDITKLLDKSDDCVLMAVTIGNEVERKTRLYEKTDLTKALIFDACATTAIESACDFIENIIKVQEAEKNKKITYRYSPGYGDLPISIQKTFLNVLNAQKRIGLTVSESNILIPRKSVTAIIGIINEDVIKIKKSCRECSSYNNCKYRKEGDKCGA